MPCLQFRLPWFAFSRTSVTSFLGYCNKPAQITQSFLQILFERGFQPRSRIEYGIYSSRILLTVMVITVAPHGLSLARNFSEIQLVRILQPVYNINPFEGQEVNGYDSVT